MLPTWNIDTYEDSDGEKETEYQLGVNENEAADSLGNNSNKEYEDDNSDYDNDMLDLAPC